MFGRKLANLVSWFELFNANRAAFEARGMLLRVKLDDRKLIQFLPRQTPFPRFFVFASEFYDRGNLKKVIRF